MSLSFLPVQFIQRTFVVTIYILYMLLFGETIAGFRLFSRTENDSIEKKEKQDIIKNRKEW